MLKIYKSSAGSGKTYTLVKEYLFLVLNNPYDYKSVLAITFTNKATAEMKSRIIDALIALSEGKSENLAKDLKNDGLTVDIQKNARKVLENILHDYSSFAVQTIDGFFQKIVRALAYELGLPLRFDIELNQDQVINNISDFLLLDVGINQNITDWLSKLLLFKINDDKGWNIDNDIHKIASELFKESLNTEANFISDENLIKLAKELKNIKDDFESIMKTYGEEALNYMEINGLSIADFSYGKSGVANYFNKIANYSSPKDFEPKTRTLEALGNPDKWYSKTSLKKNQIIETVEGTNGLMHILQNSITHYNNHFEKYITAIETHKLIHLYGLLAHLKDKLKQYRDENNAVFLSDTNNLLNVINSENDTPFVYEKIGNRFKHLLIDEFQDTSDFQWKNLLPLINNTLANGNSAIIVGDAKQSIYRWRGGNMKLLLNEVKNSLGHFDEIIQEYSLNTNYRSKHKVIQFNNQFFKTASAMLADFLKIDADDWFHKAYSIEDLHQQTSDKNLEGGYIKIQMLEGIKKENEEDDTIEQKWKEVALDKTLETIKQCQSDGYNLKDIAILVRRNTEGNDIARFLFNNGYERVISSDSLLLSRAPQIQSILNIYRYLNDRNDKISSAEILYYYTNILNKNQGNLNELFSSINLKKQNFRDDLPHDFAKYLSYLNTLPLYEMTEQIIQIFGLNKEPDAYIQRFQDLILEYSDKNNSDLQSFIDWWDENQDSDKCSLVVPENEDAITIMTIHKSKGLQFPIVIIPFAEWDLKPKANSILWVHSDEEPFNQSDLLPVNSSKSLEQTYFKDYYSDELIKNYIDNLNLLYVAFTRPEDRMYVFCKSVKESDNINSSSQLINKIICSECNDSWIFNEDINCYENGIPSKKIITSEDRDEDNLQNHKLEKYPYSRWQTKLSISPKAKSFWELFDNEKTRKINYGVLMHRVLAEIISPKDINASITKIFQQGFLSDDECQQLNQKITELISLKEVESWFNSDWMIKTESEILLPDGTTLRPDRVLIKDNNAIIIDYKTGKPEPHHSEQVQNYATILSQIGYTSINKYIFYLNEKKVVEV